MEEVGRGSIFIASTVCFSHHRGTYGRVRVTYYERFQINLFTYRLIFLNLTLLNLFLPLLSTTLDDIMKHRPQAT